MLNYFRIFEKKKTMKNKLWDKMLLNSYYPLFGYNFIIFDDKISEEISKSGKENLQIILKKIEGDGRISGRNNNRTKK